MKHVMIPSVRALVAVASCLAALGAGAAVRLPRVFGHNMVLQRGQRVPVWGKASPGEGVTVAFAGQTVGATAGADGSWRVDLAPLKASAKGTAFVVRGENEIVLKDVVVGEVWFCSGQSNMEFTMSAHRKVKDWEKEVAAANWPLIRHFNVKHNIAAAPLDDVSAKWVATTPETIPPQSAVAFFFGETLFKNLDVPIGLINCSWGGTRIEAWTPAAHPDDLWLLQNQRQWKKPQDVPTVLWNGMVAGLVPFAIKGSIWYQGCSNRADGDAYLNKTIALVRGWRREWGQGDFPYYLVQLAPYKYDNPKGTILAVVQEAQARVPSAVPNSGYTVINDLGNVKDIHPTDKRPVGMRLADQVLDRAHADAEVVRRRGQCAPRDFRRREGPQDARRRCACGFRASRGRRQDVGCGVCQDRGRVGRPLGRRCVLAEGHALRRIQRLHAQPRQRRWPAGRTVQSGCREMTCPRRLLPFARCKMNRARA